MFNHFNRVVLLVIFLISLTIKTEASVYNSRAKHKRNIRDNFGIEHDFSKNLTDVVVEVAIVCDKEFGDLFGHDRRQIMDYWTLFFWDARMRYRTLPSSCISFRVTSITIIDEISDQPFIENARNRSTGLASPDRILEHFSSWVYDKMDALPKFDLAILATNASLEWYGGFAFVNGTCKVDHEDKIHYGTMVLSDIGTKQYLNAGSHELAHLLGAEHDDEVDWCLERGFVMSDEPWESQKFFSSCSDRLIAQFLRSDDAACLHKLDELETPPVLDLDYDDALPPSIEEQCRTRTGDPEAFVYHPENAKDECRSSICWRPKQEIGVYFTPVESTVCKDGKRCFRGKCIEVGRLVVNVESSQCVLGSDHFSLSDAPVLKHCPRSSTPLERFHLLGGAGENEYLLALPYTPYSYNGTNSTGDDKCLQMRAHGHHLKFGRCRPSQWSLWDLVNIGNEEFLLYNRASRKCARQFGHQIKMVRDCSKSDPALRWKWESVLPSGNKDGCETSNGICEADLHTYITIRNITQYPQPERLSLDIGLINRKGVAVAPNVIISWKATTVKLLEIPYNCFALSPTENLTFAQFKCKLGKLLRENESALVASLEFDISEQDYPRLVFDLTPATASKTGINGPHSAEILLWSSSSRSVTGMTINGSVEDTGLTEKLIQMSSTLSFVHSYKIKVIGGSKESIKLDVNLPAKITYSDEQNITAYLSVHVKGLAIKQSSGPVIICKPIKGHFSKDVRRRVLLASGGGVDASSVAEHQDLNPSKKLVAVKCGDSSRVVCMQVECLSSGYITTDTDYIVTFDMEIHLEDLVKFLWSQNSTTIQIESRATLINAGGVIRHRHEEAISVTSIDIEEGTNPSTYMIVGAAGILLIFCAIICGLYLRKYVYDGRLKTGNQAEVED